MNKGSAIPKAFEHLLQSQYLNMMHDLRTQMCATALFHAAALERLGALSTHPLSHIQVFTTSNSADHVPSA